MGCTPVTKTVDHSGFANYFTYKTDDELGTNPYLGLLKYLNLRKCTRTLKISSLK